MALPIKPNNPNIPIPNNPFSAPLNPYLQGPYFPFVAGSGVDLNTPGIPTITNDVAAVLSAGSGISLSTVGGITTITATGGGGSGTVTSVTAGTGLTGGTITTSGTIALANTAVTAGAYTSANITIDAQGRITAAANGSSGGVTSVTGTTPIAVTAGTTPVVSIAAASTTAPGAVQLYNNTDSNSTTLALTAAQGKNLQEQITALAVTSNITLGGTYDANTGLVSSVTTQGTTAGLVVGSALPAPGVLNNEIFVIVDVQGTNGPNSPTLAHVGDWYLSDGTTWQFLNVGNQPADATPTLRGILYGCSGTTTTGVGCNILTSLGAGQCNTAVGCSVLSSIVNGGSNTAVGYNAGSSVITNGSFNVAMGSLALGNATGTGNISNNTAIGMRTLSALEAGSCNVAVGSCSMCSQISGGSNVAIGYASLWSSTTGIGNVAIGLGSLLQSSTAEYNIGVGFASMQANTTGACNIAVGVCAHDNLEGGCNNVALGFSAGQNLSTGCYNVSIGDSVCLASPTGSCQLAIGFSATDNWLTGDSTKAIKPGAGIIDCAASTGTAGQVLMSNGSNAICWGAAGGASAATPTVAGIVLGCTTATYSALGCNALVSNTTGTGNVAVGACALFSNTTGACNVAVGFNALRSITTAFGNTATGFCSLQANTTGFWTTATGFCALASNTTGNFNVANGANALLCNTTGNCNIAVGFFALQCTTGNANVAVGSSSGCGITSGSGNIVFGGVTSGASYSPVFGLTTENNRIVMGSNAVTNAYIQVPWTAVSDARDKTNVTALPVGLDFVNQLNPVSFQFKESRECDTATGPVRYGFLAQEVLAAEGENPVIVDTEVPEHLKVTNDHFNAVLVKAIQELSAKVEALEAKLAING